MLGLKVAAPGYFVVELVVMLLQDLNSLGVGPHGRTQNLTLFKRSNRPLSMKLLKNAISSGACSKT